MVRAAYSAISCFDLLCGRGVIGRSVENNISNINGLLFYH
jgi:hypothetical protein